MSDSLRSHELQHASPPCPSPTPRVHPDSHPSSPWCHPAISSSVVPFSSFPQSLPASESFSIPIFLSLLMHACIPSRFSHVWLFATLWTVNCQAPLSMRMLQARILEQVVISTLGDLPHPGVKPVSHYASCIAGGLFATSTTWEVQVCWYDLL